jgi:hypothetical protein
LQDDLRPHSQLLLLFTTSAQTHIFPEIRVDAVKFLDILLEVIPNVVVMGWVKQGAVQGQVHGGRVLEGYLGILNAGTTFGEGGGQYATNVCRREILKVCRDWTSQSNIYRKRSLVACSRLFYSFVLVLSQYSL